MNLTPEQIADIVIQKDTCISYTDEKSKIKIQNFAKSAKTDYRERVEQYEQNAKARVYSLAQAQFQLEALGYSPDVVRSLMTKWAKAVRQTWQQIESEALAVKRCYGTSIAPAPRCFFAFNDQSANPGGIVGASISPFNTRLVQRETQSKTQELLDKSYSHFVVQLEQEFDLENL